MDATVRKPSEAEKYRLEKIAEANKNRIVLESQAMAESIRVCERQNIMPDKFVMMYI